MKLCLKIITILTLLVVSRNSFARCNCDDWMSRGGYCVDYVKTRVPSFPIPKTEAEITALNNRVTAEVEEGDVAIFDLGDIWHVAYVEKVHQDGQGAATAIDVSEMNLGGQISLDEFKKRWHANEAGEWKRALCCGVTKKYDQRSIRKKISLNSVEQVWSPDIPADQEVNVGHNDDSLLDKVRETLNRFIQFTGREL